MEYYSAMKRNRVAYVHKGILLGHEKEEMRISWTEVEEPRAHYTEWIWYYQWQMETREKVRNWRMNKKITQPEKQKENKLI